MDEGHRSAIRPHGGTLVDRRLRGTVREAALERAHSLPKIELNRVAMSDVELLAVGAYSPLTGFMGRADYEAVVEQMRLADGLPWTIPITLAVSEEQAARLKEGQEVALVEPGGRVLAILELEEKFTYDKEREATCVYRTTDLRHPGVARLHRQGPVLLGGNIWLLNMPSQYEFPEFRHTPAETRRLFAARGWRRVVAFQTRNPIHRAHEYIQKTALELVDGLFLHPLVGETKPDDIPPEVRMESYQAILRDYYPAERVLLGVFPAAMRYAGPREAVFHALCRKNYGCTHMIIGRDHAGVGNFYGPYDAHTIFEAFEPEELGIVPLFFDRAFYCRACGGIVTVKTCPHDASHHVVLSGTEVRRRLERGELLPAEFTRPAVSRVLIEGLRRYRASRARDASSASPDTGPQPQEVVMTNSPEGRRLFVIGLDCAEPSLVFERWRDQLPTLSRLMEQGTYGRLESCHPPITVPAWSCMLSGRDPGQLGIYGFRNRADYSYHAMFIATSNAVKVDRVWDVLGRAGKRSILVGVPQTYPVRPVHGHLISSFLTPSTGRQYTYPASLKEEIGELLGSPDAYEFDVRNFRTEDKRWLLEQIYTMTEKRLKVIRWLIENKPWDFFMWVEMGTDRIHHGFWKYMDPEHRKHEPGNEFEQAILDYYRFLDQAIGELLALVPDDTAVMVVSDHGAKRMDGGICINEWLRREGWLVLKEEPRGVVPIEKCEVDWSRTRAWGAGGYYARIFLNVEGREPQGIIPQERYEAVRDELAEALAAIPDDQGRPLPNRVLKPEEVYAEVNGIAPDLIVYFGDLHWRSVGSLGLNRVHTFENDIGPDDANHAQHGLYIFYDPARPGHGRRVDDRHIMDIAPTILATLGVDVPPGMRGTAFTPDATESGYSADEEQAILDHLESLGYL